MFCVLSWDTVLRVLGRGIIVMVGEFVSSGEEVEGPAVEGEGELDFGFVGVAVDGCGAAGELRGSGHCLGKERVGGGGRG